MSGRIYASTGNGQFDAGSGGDNYGDSLLSLGEDLSSLLGSYTPTDYQQLENGDTDLGKLVARNSARPSIEPDSVHDRAGR